MKIEIPLSEGVVSIQQRFRSPSGFFLNEQALLFIAELDAIW
jgi:hypothetical protein